jgi:hypothetical protein
MSGPLMLDPSLFTSFRTLRVIHAALISGELRDVVLPDSFSAALERGTFAENGLAYFGASRREIDDLRNLQAYLPEILSIPRYRRAADEKPSASFQRALTVRLKEHGIAET